MAADASDHFAMKIFPIPIQYSEWEKRRSVNQSSRHQIKEVKHPHTSLQNILMGHLTELTLLGTAWHFLVIIVKYCSWASSRIVPLLSWRIQQRQLNRSGICSSHLNLLATGFFFQILEHSVFKLWLIQKPNKVALWNKRHFEEKKMEFLQHV